MSSNNTPQPKFKFGDIVKPVQMFANRFEVTQMRVAPDSKIMYSYTDGNDNTLWFHEAELELYTPPARVYSLTREQLAEAYLDIHGLIGPSFERFCAHLGVVEND
jgi:hypothetical protein